MNAFLGWWLKSAILLLVALLATLILRRAPAADRHRLWLTAIVASTLLPFLTPAPRAAFSIALPDVLSNALPLAAIPRTPVGPAFSWQDIAVWLWAAGAVYFALRLGVAHLRVRAVVRQARVLGSIATETGRAVSLRAHADVHVAFSTGIVRPCVVVPEALLAAPNAQRDCVIAHELAHVARHDLPSQLFAELFRVVAWLHPLSWMALRALAVSRELACDERVLKSGALPSTYAEVLLASARGAPSVAAAGMGSVLGARVRALLAPRPRARRLRAAGMVVLLGCVAIACGRTSPSGADRDEARALEESGLMALKANNLEAARVTLLASVRADPSSAAPHRALGITHARLGLGQEAVAHYKAYLRLAPQARDAEIVRKIVADYENAED